MISTQPQEFEGMLSTVKHEIIHALVTTLNSIHPLDTETMEELHSFYRSCFVSKGFSAGLFAFYHDDDGKPLTPRSASGLPAYNER